MRVLLTGSAGFLGRRLTLALLERGQVADATGTPTAFDTLVLLDSVAATPPDDPRVESITGDIGDPAVIASAVSADTASVFHLAAIVSGGAEADFDLGMRVNLDATRQLLDRCRTLGHRPRFVFASSVAVYGGDLPARVTDRTILTPQSSYGTQKAMAELLINDYTRRGFVDGRSLRLPTISVRAGRPNAALSSFASGIIREPLNGEVARCPVPPETPLWLLSPDTVVACLLVGHDLDGAALGANRSVILPGLTVTAGAMVEALARIAGPEVAGRVEWRPDERIQQVASTWPGAFDDARGRRLGFPVDADIDGIIHQYIERDLGHAPAAGAAPDTPRPTPAR